MTGWRTIQTTANPRRIHVYPVDDLVEHDLTGVDCPCRPRVDSENGGQIIVHNSWGGREAGEYLDAIKGGINQ